MEELFNKIKELSDALDEVSRKNKELSEICETNLSELKERLLLKLP